MDCRPVLILVASAILGGCVVLKGVGNTTLVKPLPPTGTFRLEGPLDTEPAVARKVGQMIAYQLLKRGYRNPADAQPDLLARFDFDVTPAGSHSTAFTTIDQPRQKYVASGNTLIRKQSTASAFTTVKTSTLFQRLLVVRLVDRKTGDTYWEGQASAVGECGQFFVVAPQIVALLFERFPEDLSNSRRDIPESDPEVMAIRNLFPRDTNWGCR